MMYDEKLIADFASRTRRNLDAIRKLRSLGCEVYEVTALVNSLLGLLVFPHESYLDSIPETPIEHLQRDGWPIPEVHGPFRQAPNLRKLIRYLRNAVAHCHLQFNQRDGEVSGLVAWNQWEGRRTWEAEFTMEQVEGIAEKFSQLLCGTLAQSSV